MQSEIKREIGYLSRKKMKLASAKLSKQKEYRYKYTKRSGVIAPRPVIKK